MSKEERDLTLMMELNRILGEVFISSEYIKSLFQEELNSETFTIEKQQYRRRKNLLVATEEFNFFLKENLRFSSTSRYVRKLFFLH